MPQKIWVAKNFWRVSENLSLYTKIILFVHCMTQQFSGLFNNFRIAMLPCYRGFSLSVSFMKYPLQFLHYAKPTQLRFTISLHITVTLELNILWKNKMWDVSKALNMSSKKQVYMYICSKYVVNNQTTHQSNWNIVFFYSFKSGFCFLDPTCENHEVVPK